MRNEDLDADELLNEALEMDMKLVEEIWPILEQFDEEYPQLDSLFALFVNVIHELFEQEWTLEELLQEVKSHYEIWSESSRSEELH